MSIQDKVTVKPDLAALGQLWIRQALSTTNCHKIATVTSFDPDTQSAQCTINYKKVFNGNLVDYPILVGCPVITLGGGLGSYLTFPDPTGEDCLVFFNDDDMSNWVATGQVIAPSTQRKHAFSDAIILVGLNSFASPIDSYDPDNVTLNAGSALVNLKNQVTDLKTVLQGLVSAVETFVATGVVASGAGAGGTLSFAAGLAAFEAYKTTIAGLLK